MAASLTHTKAVVPAIWPLEVANVLVMGERRKRSTEIQATAFTSRLLQLPITVDDRTVTAAWSSTLRLARAHQLSAYDAAYLELALREGIPVATLDKTLKAAAIAAGADIYQPK